MSTHFSPKQQSQSESTDGDSTDSDSLLYTHATTAKCQELIQDPHLFWREIRDFHLSSRTKFKVPTIGGNALDLHRLFTEVTSRGGIEKVLRDRVWKEVVGAFKFPPTITSGSFVLRKYYYSLLYHFEQVYYFNKEVPSISLTDDQANSICNGSATIDEAEEGTYTDSSAGAGVEIGSYLTGTLDGKFDDGYLITMTSGSEELKGVLYHLPDLPPVSTLNNSDIHPHFHRKVAEHRSSEKQVEASIKKEEG